MSGKIKPCEDTQEAESQETNQSKFRTTFTAWELLGESRKIYRQHSCHSCRYTKNFLDLSPSLELCV